MFDDEKIKIIQAMPDGDAILVIWIKLITLAGKTNDGGYVYISNNIPYTEEMLSIIMNKPIMTVKMAMETFASLGMVENDTKGIYLVNFDKHQSLDRMQEIKEYNRLAQQRSREKRKALVTAKDVSMTVNDMSMTSQCCQETDRDIEEDIDKEKDKDKEKESIASPAAKATRHKYGAYNNVLLTDTDMEKLKTEFPDWQERIERLSEYIASTGKSYKNHLATIRSWAKKDKVNGTRTAAQKNAGFFFGQEEDDLSDLF
jgi:predicted phage replisome organizer